MVNTNNSFERIEISVAFHEKHRVHRSNIRKKSNSANKRLSLAHKCAFSAVISYQDRIQGQKYSRDKNSAVERMGLIAQFIQGIELTKSSITDGLYLNAGNLLKQELEILVALDEFETNRRRDRKTPNVKNGQYANFYNRYSELNDLAHPSHQELIEVITTFSEGKRCGPTTVPQFNIDFYRSLFGNQAMFLIKLLGHMKNIFVEVFEEDIDEAEKHLVRNAIDLLEKEKIIQINASV